MSNNLGKALYLSAGLLLCIISLSFFFSRYAVFQDYMDEAFKAINEDKLVKIDGDIREREITYSEVLHKVLETKRQYETAGISIIYSSAPDYQEENISEPFTEFRPDVYVDGVNARVIDIACIDSAILYACDYDTDVTGKIISILYTSK